MKTVKNLERLQQIHLLIENENTGSPYELANQMGVSERLIYNLIEQLKDFNANICYDRSRKTYYYLNDFQLQVSISVSIISDEEVTEVFGGSYFEKNTKSSFYG
ncbi:HTH domain-containing protein [Flagellimonas onchidii]|uniref:HTH domain-containing protein n=1 Tax=Flagellimonas onchidii TaxID=2562684 RepID=UPI0010A5CFB0|nr:HTH domain-containing protein [Allomuricauda onchidii]